MATNEILAFEKPMLDNRIVEYEHTEIRAQDSNYNVAGEIRLEIRNENVYTRPSDSYLLVEGELNLTAGGHYAANAEVTLIKEGILYLFSNLRYYINEKEVESIYYPGQTQNMLSYLLEDNGYDKTVALSHCGSKDNHLDATTANNTAGYTLRKGLILSSNPTGRFSFYIPLRRLFGFFRDFDKLVFGTTQRLTLVRLANENDAIFRNNAAGAGSVELTKVSWFVPHIWGTDETNLELLKLKQSEKSIDISFRGLSSSRISMPQDNSFTWKLSAKTAPEVPRYLLLAFQTGKENNQEQNPALFDHCNLTNLRVLLNERQYPSTEYTANFALNQFSRIYVDAVQFKSKFFEIESTEKEIVSASGLNMTEYKALFPIYVVDLSKQLDRVKRSSSDITIEARFGANIVANTVAYCVTISDKFLKLESDGERLILVQ